MILASEDTASSAKETTASKAADVTESDLAKSSFLARMSHEMRTPLNAIIGMCTIAKSTRDTEETASCLSRINDASLHLLAMINDILNVAKIESGKLKLSHDKFNLTQMLQKAAESIKFTLDAKKHNLKLDFDTSLPAYIYADEQMLAHVLHNLLSNAIKFTPPEGTITLSVRKINGDERTCTLEFKVSDTGIGISPESTKKVFALFEQLDGSASRKYEGTGMGLAISRSIVKLLGGDIHVASEPGKGSSFSFEITLSKDIEKPASPPGDTAETSGEKPKFANRAILLAEDVEINREIVLSLLEDTGVAVDCAGNGLQAVEMFRANPSRYGLILMDIHMPEMDGFEATRQIRAIEKKGNSPEEIPIIAMTANIFKDDVEKCLEAGMNYHLGKPLDFEELLKQLDKFLQ